MSKYYFTDEQIEELKKNPYVKKVSKTSVIFTEEFKTKFIHLYNQGIGPTEIIRRFGINPKIIRKNRIDKLTIRLRKHSLRPEGFSRKPNSSKGKPRKKKHPEFNNDSEKAEYYKEYSERLEQEIELLKKIEALEEVDRVSRVKNSR